MSNAPNRIVRIRSGLEEKASGAGEADGGGVCEWNKGSGWALEERVGRTPGRGVTILGVKKFFGPSAYWTILDCCIVSKCDHA